MGPPLPPDYDAEPLEGDNEYMAPEDVPRDPADFDDISIDEEEHEKFRYPMEPGETRRNPIFGND